MLISTMSPGVSARPKIMSRSLYNLRTSPTFSPSSKNSERRISYLHKAVEPPAEALPDIDIFMKFAQAMDFPGFDYKNAAEIFDEHCRLTKGTNIDITGLSYERLKKEGSFQWPVPDKNHPGTERLFTDFRFYTESGKMNFNVPSRSENQSEKVNEEFPMVLTTGRVRDQWHTRTRTGKVNRPSPL